MPCGSRSGPQWHVVTSHPQAERRAAQHLAEQGYEAYLPLLAVQRRDAAIRSLKHTVLVPLFSRYLFVRFDNGRDPWRPILSTLGVATLLRRQDTGIPEPCPEAAISALQATEASRRSLTPARAAWAPGAVCAPANGILAGHRAVVLRVTRSHATVALMLLGALREVTLPLDSLAPAN
jgi:transcriptional antiterminator RfaH